MRASANQDTLANPRLMYERTRALAYLLWWCLRLRPDIVQACDPDSWVVAWLAARLYGGRAVFDVHEMLHDIAKRRFITAGMTAFALLIPLAMTSTKWSIRKLGKRWQMLHRLIYFSAAAGVIHYIWLVKADLKKPLEYAFVLGMLLTYRLVAWVVGRKVTPKRVTDSGAQVVVQ